MAADASIIVKTDVDNKKAQSKLKKLEGQIDKLNQKISGKQQTMSPLVEQSKQLGAALDEAKRKLYNMQNNTDFYYTTAQVKEQEKTVKAMTAEYNKLNDKIDKMGNSVKADTAKLEEMQSEAGELAGQLAGAGKSTKVMSEAAETARQRIGNMSKTIATLAKRIFVFSLITAALRKIKDYMWEAIRTNDKAMAAVAQLKGALMTLAQPLVEIIIPAFTALVRILTAIIYKIADVVSRLFGTTAKNSAAAAKSLYDQKNALESVGSAAKSASKQLASFDEINKLSEDSGDGFGGAEYAGISPDFNRPNVSDYLDNILNIVKSIGVVIAGWALSTKLLNGLEKLTGLRIPTDLKIGISLVVAGVALAADNIANIITGEYKGASLNSLIREIISGVMIGLGASLISGGAVSALWAVPVAVALTIAVTEIIVNWDGIKTMWKDVIDGFAALFAGDEDVFWQKMTDAMSTWMGGDSFAVELAKKILGDEVWEAAQEYIENGGTLDKAIETVAKRAWDNLTAPFVNSGGWFHDNVIQPIQEFFAPLSEFIGKIFEGARLIVQAVWKIVSEWFNERVIQPIINFFEPIVETVGGFFRDLWDSITKIWKDVSGWFSEHVIDPVAEAWETALEDIKNFAKGIFNKILGFFEKVVNGLIDGLNQTLSGFNAAATWAGNILGKDWSGIGTIQHVSIPRLAQGAVIPPNREFMAVLGDQKSGTNIETPLETMVQAFKIALAESGYNGSNEAVLMLDRDVLGRVVYRLNKAESTRVGVSLVEGKR